MTRVHAAIAAARRRALLADLTRRVGTATAWGAAVGLGLVLVDRLVGVGPHWALLLGVPTVLGSAVGAAVAVARRPGELAAAGMLDDALALRDRLTNGLTLAHARGQDGAFVELALREAEQAAATVQPRRAIALRFGSAWRTWPALLALGVAAAVLLPPLDLLGRAAARDRAVLEQSRRERVAEQLAAAVEAVRPAAAPESPDAPARPDPRSAELDRIRQELEQGRLSPQDAAARAVQELESIAEREQREAEAAAMRQREIEDALGGLTRSRPRSTPESNDELGDVAQGGAPNEGSQGEESALTRAIRQGDLAAAREAVSELLRPKQPLDAAAREQLANDLRRLAEDIEQLERQEAEQAARRAAAEARERAERTSTPDAEQPEGARSEREDRTQSEPAADAAKPEDSRLQHNQRAQKTGEQVQQNSGEQRPDGQPRQNTPGERAPSGERREGTQPVDPEQLQRQLEREGLSPEDARRAAEQIAREAQREQARDQAREQRRELADRLREASDALKPQQRDGRTTPQGDSPPPDQRRPGEQPRADSQAPDQQRDAGKSGEPTARPEQGQPTPADVPPTPAPTPAPSPSPGASPQPSPDGQKQEPEPTPAPQPGPDGQRPEAVPAPKPDANGPKSDRPAGAPDGQRPSGERPAPGAERSATPPPDQNQPGDEHQDAPDGSLPEPGNLPEPTPEAIERLAEHLKDMARNSDRRQQSAEAARRAREQAEQIAKGLSDDQRKRLEQWAEALARQRPDVMDELAGQSPDGPSDQQDPPRRGGDAPGTQEARQGTGPAQAPPPGPRRTEIVDARPRESGPRGSEREQVVAEWLSPPREGDAAPSTATPRERLLQAARSAQKAVDDRAIPSRYDRLVQRYFRRLPERVEEDAAERPGPSGRTLP